MAWTNKKGFNFRSTAAYVTDGTNEIVVCNPATNTTGPTYGATATIDGDIVTYGWESTAVDGERDYNDTVDPRLAGGHGMANTGQIVFRIDLPSAGTYAITLATGNNNFDSRQYWQIVDDTTVLDTFDTTSTNTPGNDFYDANGTLHDGPANWVSNNTPKEYLFNSTILRIRVGGNNASNNTSSVSSIKHLGVRYVASAPSKSLGLLMRGCG